MTLKKTCMWMLAAAGMAVCSTTLAADPAEIASKNKEKQAANQIELPAGVMGKDATSTTQDEYLRWKFSQPAGQPSGLRAPPSNDDCTTPIALTCGAITADNTMATKVSDPTPSCQSSFSATVWYTFQPSQTGFTIDTCAGAAGDSVLSVYGPYTVGSNPCPIPAAQQIQCSDDFCSTRSSVTVVGADTTKVYYIMLSSFGAAAAGQTWTLTTTCFTPPANDGCAGAAAIAIGGSITGVNNATASTDTAPTCTGVQTRGLWYTFTGNGHNVTVTTCSAGTTANTDVAVYTGTCAGLTCFQGATTASPACVPANTNAANTSFCAASGTVYYVLVGGSTAGLFDLAVTDNGLCPANDTCTGALSLGAGGLGSAAAVSNTLASNEVGVPSCTGSTLRGLWYTFTGTGAQVVVSTCGAGTTSNTDVAVYTGSSCSSLVCVQGSATAANPVCSPTNANSASATVCSVNGLTYYVLIGATTAGNFDLSISAGAACTPFPNDYCVTAQTITPGTTLSAVSRSGATTDAAPSCTGSQTNGIWYRVVGNGHALTINTCGAGTTTNTDAAVYTGTCAGLTCVAGTTSSPSPACTPANTNATVFTFCAVSGQTFYILIGGSTTGTLDLSLIDTGASCPPANDECVGAIALSCGSTSTVDLTFASKNASDPVPSCQTSFGHTLWYKIQPTAPTFTVDTCSTVINSDSVLTIYGPYPVGSNPCPITAGQQLACSDDFCGLRSSVTVAGADLTKVYYVQFATFGSGTGVFTTALSCVNPPANDVCTGAAALAIGGNTGVVDNTNGTNDSAPSCTTAQLRGLWYTFTGNGHVLTASTCDAATTADTGIAVFSGACASLTCVGGNDTSSPACASPASAASVTFCGFSGQTFYVLVSGATIGNFKLSLADTLVSCPPANDTIGGAIAVTVPSTTGGSTTFAATDGAPTCNGVSDSSAGVWYSLSGTGNTITASTCNPGTTYDTRVSVYCGNPAVVSALNCVTANDTASPTCGALSGAATAIFCSQPGATYYILVHGNFATGNFLLDVSDDGAACAAAVACLPQGACCVGATCSITTQGACTGLAGSYQGDNSSCVTLGAVVTTYTSSPALAIPDNTPAGITDTITVTDTSLTGDINVRVNIPDHTFIGDLIITLGRSGGPTVTVWNRQCGTNAGMNVTFDDEGVAVVCAEPTVGTYLPSSALSAFDGAPLNGTYTLTVSDNAGLDTGTLADWSLITTNGAPVCTPTNPCPADWNGDLEVNGNDISDYINSWYGDILAGTVIADFNGDGETNGNDISDYINAWYAAIICGGYCC